MVFLFKFNSDRRVKTPSDTGKSGRIRFNLSERLRSSSPSTPIDPTAGNIDHVTGKIHPTKTISLAQQLEQMKTAGQDSFLRSITIRNTIHPHLKHPDNRRNMTSATSLHIASSHNSTQPSTLHGASMPSPLPYDSSMNDAGKRNRTINKELVTIPPAPSSDGNKSPHTKRPSKKSFSLLFFFFSQNFLTHYLDFLCNLFN